jgi:DNA-binding MarR family transcriptional regulator
MTAKLELEELILRVWFMIHHTHDMLKICEDQVFSKYGLTTEQYVVLVTIKYLGEPARVTDVARWLARSPNSISMIGDRMVKAGLITRKRDKRDRRVVNLYITSKGENAFKPAMQAGWDFIHRILSPLSREDQQTILRLLLAIQYETVKYLHPEAGADEIRKAESARHDDLFDRLCQYISTSVPKTKRHCSKTRKTTRRR